MWIQQRRAPGFIIGMSVTCPNLLCICEGRGVIGDALEIVEPRSGLAYNLADPLGRSSFLVWFL